MDSGRETDKKVILGSDSGLGFTYIPDGLVVELLIRLPIKCIFRCKCVSKQWLSIINDPTFARDFVSRIALPSTQRKHWTLLYKCIYAAEVPREHDFKRNLFSSEVGLAGLTKFDLPASARAHGIEEYKGFYYIDYIFQKDEHGLLLCGRNSGGQIGSEFGKYYIFNPINKQCVLIPQSKRPFVYSLAGIIAQVKDCVVTSYKVIRCEDGDGRTSVLRFDVFSSETGEWKAVDIHFPQVLKIVPFRKRAVVIKEILHLVDRELGILAYDPYRSPNSCRIIRFPEDINREGEGWHYGRNSLFDVHQGYLRYFEMSDASYNVGFRSLSVWILSDYEEGLWSLEHRIISDEVSSDVSSFNSSYIVPIAFHPFDSDTVYLGYGQSILSYNIQTRKLIVLGNLVNLETESIWEHVYHFVFPGWPISIQDTSFKSSRN